MFNFLPSKADYQKIILIMFVKYFGLFANKIFLNNQEFQKI